MSHWALICQDCWQALYPNDHVPQLSAYSDCDSCGNDGTLTIIVHPEVARAAAALVNPPICDIGPVTGSARPL